MIIAPPQAQYQQVSATRLFQAYIDAPKTPVPVVADGAFQRVAPTRSRVADPNPAELLEIDLDVSRCTATPSILLAYDRPFSSFSRVYRLADRSTGPEPTRVFQPIYAGFAGLQLSGVTSACLKTVSRVAVPDHVPLLLPATLPPSWRRSGLFEQMMPLRLRW